MDTILHEENRLSWNAATVAHNSHKGDQAAFFRNGGSKLHSEEKALLGDIQGLSVVHLQCNSGQDTLSLAQIGAQVVGIDISDTAIDFARQLSQDTNIPATFYRADVYDWLAETAKSTQRFDIAFCSYGAICWLSNVNIWAPGLALTSLQEYPYTQGFKPYEHMQRVDNRWYLPADQPTLPLMFSITAQKPQQGAQHG